MINLTVDTIGEYAYKFVDHVKDQTNNSLLSSYLWFFENRKDLTSGYVRSMGFFYDYRPFLKKYIVKFHYGGFSEYYARSVKELRENLNLSKKDQVQPTPFNRGTL